MQDVQLEKEITLAENYSNQLRHFFDCVQTIFKQQEVTPENTETLMDLREKLPHDRQRFYSEVSHEHNEKNLGKLLVLTPDPKSVIRLTDFQIQDLRSCWHQEYMDLHYYLGKLLYRRELLEKVNPAVVKLKRMLFNPVVFLILVVIAAYFLLLAIF